MNIQLSRRTVALAIVAFLAFAAVATTSLVLTLTRDANAGAGFSDTPPWIAAHAEWLQDNGIADGYPTNPPTFEPDDNITRGQAAYWFGNFNNAIETVTRPLSSNPILTTGSTQELDCPTGKRAIAGGGSAFGGFLMEASEPYDNTKGGGDGRTGWRIIWKAKGTFGNFDSTMFVTCAPYPIPD